MLKLCGTFDKGIRLRNYNPGLLLIKEHRKSPNLNILMFLWQYQIFEKSN